MSIVPKAGDENVPSLDAVVAESTGVRVVEIGGIQVSEFRPANILETYHPNSRLRVVLGLQAATKRTVAS